MMISRYLKNKKLKKISFFLTLITIIFFVFLAKKKIKQDCLSVTEKYVNIEYNGIVIKKFEDMKNHAAQTLLIKANNREQIYRKYRDVSGLYGFAQVGDSIKKDSHSLKVYLYRQEKEFEFTIDFKCEDLK